MHPTLPSAPTHLAPPRAPRESPARSALAASWLTSRRGRARWRARRWRRRRTPARWRARRGGRRAGRSGTGTFGDLVVLVVESRDLPVLVFGEHPRAVVVLFA